MKTYNFSVFKDRIKPLSPTKGVSGNTNFYECTFEFSEDWDSLSAFAVFVGEDSYTAAILDGKCIVPHEVLSESGEIYIGVYATNGEDNLLRISTNLIPFEVEEGALREGNTPVPPSIDVWETYIAAMNQTLLDTRDARDEAQKHSNDAKGHSDAAKAAATDSTLSAYAASESADRAAQSETNAYTSKEFAEGYANEAEEYSKAAKDEVENAKAEVKKAEGFATEAEDSRYNASMHEAKTEEYKTDAVNAMANAITSADEARINKEGAEKAYQDTLAETENLVHKDNAEEISGIKNFLNGIKTARITSDGALVLETLDNPLIIYANGEYEFYSGDILVDGKSIVTDSPVYVLVTADQVITKKIQGDSENGDIEIQADGITINSGSGISFSASTGINFQTNGTYVAVDGKEVATKEDVNNKNKFYALFTNILSSDDGLDISAVEGISINSSEWDSHLYLDADGCTLKAGKCTLWMAHDGWFRINNKEIATEEFVENAVNNVNITIDGVPTEGSTNAVSSGGVKSYVDSSIQQAILDSWAEVIEP